MAAIFGEKMRENYYNSSNIHPMSMKFSIYELYWWYKYLGKTDKSPINNAELQRIVLGKIPAEKTIHYQQRRMMT